MNYDLLARRLYVVAIGASLITGALFIVGACWHLDDLIYAGTAMAIITAVATVGSLILTIIEVDILNERKKPDAKDP